jgi:urease accessory protein
MRRAWAISISMITIMTDPAQPCSVAADGRIRPGYEDWVATGAGEARSDPAAIMRLLTWLSPAFPTGAYAYSHGLEWAVETHDIRDGQTLCDWLSDVIAQGSARADTILLRHAHRAANDPTALRDIVALALACASGRERHDEALALGRAFLRAAAGWGLPELPEDIPYAVAVGAMAGAHGIDEDITAGAYLQTFASNLISAAVRLVPLGQTTGLQTLAALEPVILQTAAATRPATLDDLGGCAFRSDLAAMRHETQYTRLFRS